MKVIELGEGQSVREALTEAGAPDPVIDIVSAIMGEDLPLCDCPPGVCLGDSTLHTGSTDDEFTDSEDDEFTVDFEPDFELSCDPVTAEDHIEAVAQLGRIVETLGVVAEIHARLVKDLVG
jgi:hypothetical protein